VFAMRDIDLCKIESRPIHGKPFKYLFYVDFEGSQFNEAGKNALNHLKEVTMFLKVLGTYPAGETVEAKPKKR
jgi:prephenate dehydratase